MSLSAALEIDGQIATAEGWISGEDYQEYLACEAEAQIERDYERYLETRCDAEYRWLERHAPWAI
jgi:hypothetical protein